MRRPRTFPDNGPTSRLLLVEGADDFAVAFHLDQHHRFTSMCSVEDAGGVENMLSSLPVRLKTANEDRLGVVVDADVRISRRWRQLRDILRVAGFAAVPVRPDPEGTVLRH